MKTRTRKIVIASMISALICVATMIIKIPSPLKGYINLGDAVVLLASWTLSPLYGFLAAGIGSALADILSGYAIYSPATFIIKGCMQIISYYAFGFLHLKISNIASRIISGVFAEIVMILGYYIFEGFIYGFIEAIVNIPASIVQAIAGIIFGIILINLFEKNKVF